jgi:hypothetical protein
VRATFAHVLDGCAGRQEQDCRHEADHDVGWTAAVATLRGRCDGLDPGARLWEGPVGFDSNRARGPTAAQGCSERDQRGPAAL